MSKPNSRGSLIGLKSSLPAMPKAAPIALTAEMERRILGNDVDTSLHKDVRTDSTAPAVALDPRNSRGPVGAGGQRKEPTVLMNAKLPVHLHARLKRTAQFNDISMTDILIRAIEVELATGNYTAPPETWGSDSV